MMRAITMKCFGEADVLKLEQIPTPEPGENEVLVKLYAAGVNPAETYIRTGTYAFFKPALPFTPGFDGAGIIDQVGPGVTRLKPGDRVMVMALLAKKNTGTYAEMVVCDADAVYPLPAHLSFAQGAAIGVPGHTAYRALFQRGALKPGETVLIHGATGGVGTMAVQLARAYGAFVIGTGGGDNKLDDICQNGAHAAFNHADPGHFDQILELTGERGVDVIVESLANVNLENDAKISAMFGRIVVVGNRGSLDFNPRLLMIKESSVLGMALWNSPSDEYKASLAALAAGLEADTLKPLIGKTYPLEAAAQAQRDILEPGATQGKMILSIRPE